MQQKPPQMTSSPHRATNWQKILDAVVSGQLSEKMLMPYMKFLSMPLVSRWGDRYIEIDWEATTETHQGTGLVFGGYISALADYAAGSVMLTFIGDRDMFFTNGLEIEYLRPIRTGTITIRAEVTGEADSKVKVEVTFRNGKGDTCAVSRVNQTLLRQS